MKFVAIIIATFITVLTVQPSVQLIFGSANQEETCCTDSCCESDDRCSQNPDTQNPSDCCPGGICNPFEACACCCGAVVSRPSVELITSFIEISFNKETQNNLVLGFRSECYQPPEVA